MQVFHIQEMHELISQAPQFVETTQLIRSGWSYFCW